MESCRPVTTLSSSVCLSICLSVCLSVCLFGWLVGWLFLVDFFLLGRVCTLDVHWFAAPFLSAHYIIGQWTGTHMTYKRIRVMPYFLPCGVHQLRLLCLYFIVNFTICRIISGFGTPLLLFQYNIERSQKKPMNSHTTSQWFCFCHLRICFAVSDLLLPWMICFCRNRICFCREKICFCSEPREYDVRECMFYTMVWSIPYYLKSIFRAGDYF